MRLTSLTLWILLSLGSGNLHSQTKLELATRLCGIRFLADSVTIDTVNSDFSTLDSVVNLIMTHQLECHIYAYEGDSEEWPAKTARTPREVKRDFSLAKLLLAYYKVPGHLVRWQPVHTESGFWTYWFPEAMYAQKPFAKGCYVLYFGPSYKP